MDDFSDDSLFSTISSFQPVAVSTATKSSLDASTFTVSKNRFRLSVSPYQPTQRSRSSRNDMSPSHRLRNESFFTPPSNTIDIMQDQDKVSWHWGDYQQQEDNEDWSGEFNGNGIENNLEFIENEEIENKAAHPFLQEELMVSDAGQYSETSSWSVSRAVARTDGRSPGLLHTSNGSSVSPTSFFQRKSAGPLGQLDGSHLSTGQRPNLGFKSIRQNIRKDLRVLDNIDHLEKGISRMNTGHRQDNDNESDLEQGRNEFPCASDQPTLERRLTAKPPRIPNKLQRESLSAESNFYLDNVASFRADNNSMNATCNSFLAPSVMKDVCQNVSISDASNLAKRILALYEHEKQKKHEHKEKRSKQNALKLNLQGGESKTKVERANRKEVVPSSYEERPSNELRQEIKRESGLPEHKHQHETNHNSAASKFIEMTIDGVLYKGILYAQPDS